MGSHLLQKYPFILELFFNGSYLFLYSLNKYNKIPSSWNQDYVLSILDVSSRAIPIVMFLIIIAQYLNVAKFEAYLRKHVFSLIVFVPLVITWGDMDFCYWLASIHLFSSILTLYESGPEVVVEKKRWRFLRTTSLKPSQIVIITFIALIFTGFLLLILPISSKAGKSISMTDALFMATSATCVTGLATLSISSDLSLFGQLVILVLVQIGGLGIMTLSYGMTILLGRTLGVKERVVMQDLLNVSSLEELISNIVDIIKYTFIIEFWGAVVLTIAFSLEGFDFIQSLYYGFFHSVSAFCNAGLSLFDSSFENFATKPLIHGTLSVLITMGGLGFIVLRELLISIQEKRSLARLSLHTKIVLVTSIILTVVGSIVVFYGEYLNSLDGFSLWEKIQISVFQSITLRTAGFNTIPLSSLHIHTIYLMSILMFIGASPGSTGGGIKTASFAILIQSIISTLKGRNRVEFFDRTISNVLVVKATALTIISIIATVTFVFLLLNIEKDQTFLSIFFEVVSAQATVGLSLGITPFLTVAGKLVLSVLMFIGRVGPLTLVLAIAQQRKQVGLFDYPVGRLMIG